MTIQIRQIMINLEKPTWLEVQELGKVINFLDKENISYDLNPPIKREITH